MSETPAYGAPASAEVVLSQGFEGHGLEYLIQIVDDSLKSRIKPRRRIPTVVATDFMNSIVESNGRFFFSGVLNDWPGLTTLEILNVKAGKKVVWKQGSKNHGRLALPKDFSKQPVLVLAIGPDYTKAGWTKDNPGYVYWADAREDGKVRSLYVGREGIKMAREVETRDGVATKVHMFGHRYAKKKESLKDSVSYHTGVLIEWDHAQFCTVVELAWLNGLGGYNGNSNWLYDSFGATVGSLYSSMSPQMKVPWTEKRSEVRFFDVPWKSAGDMERFFAEHKGKGGRFIDPKIRVSADVKLENPTIETVYSACLNYIMNDGTYAEPTLKKFGNNCQSFAANFQAYMAGKYTRPFTLLMAPIYKARVELFDDITPIET